MDGVHASLSTIPIILMSFIVIYNLNNIHNLNIFRYFFFFFLFRYVVHSFGNISVFGVKSQRSYQDIPPYRSCVCKGLRNTFGRPIH